MNAQKQLRIAQKHRTARRRLKTQSEALRACEEPQPHLRVTHSRDVLKDLKMTKSLLTGIALIIVWSGAYTPALAQERSVGSRIAACRSDCRAGNTHGLYRAYNSADPDLKSPEGQKMYAECVRLCSAPLPASYFQKGIIEAGLPWFGKFKSDCMQCHTTGDARPTAIESPERATGVIMPTDYLRRDP